MIKPIVSKQGTKKRRCTRCGGAVSVDFDLKAGYYRSCLNCSMVEYLSKSNRENRTEGRTGKICQGIYRTHSTYCI